MNSLLYLKVEAVPGKHLQEVLIECSNLASRIGINVQCQLNDVLMSFYPNGTQEEAWARYCAKINRPKG